ncbi:MAG: LAGLIDADG family homing endonuclease [Candidatus Diapherotrites archaeon]
MRLDNMASFDVGKKSSVVGRSLDDIEKYGDKATAYFGKSVMSSGERPVLGRRILLDVAKPHVMLICGKRGGGKCLDGDTEIVLKDGTIKKIKDLEYDARQIMSLDNTYKINGAEKSAFYKRNVSKMLELTLRSGKKIKLTHEHPLLTIDGWTPVQELSLGARIATPRKIDSFGSEFMKECEIKLLAYLLAEGHTKGKVVWFTNSDKAIVEDFKNSVKQFDKNLEVNKSPNYGFRVVRNEKTRRYPKNKHSLRQFLIELKAYGKLAPEKTIPEKVFNLPKNKIALLLNRMFSCDGSIYFESNRWRMSYSTSSPKMASQIHHLLLRFGILSKIRDKITKSNGKYFKNKELVISGEPIKTFVEEIGFFGGKEEKQKQAMKYFLTTIRNTNLDTIPKEIWGQYKPENWAEVGRKIGYKHPKALRESMRYAPSRQKLLQIAKADNNKLIESLATSDIYWDEIVSKKELKGNFTVYDITVDENHNFIANDIIVHNSFSMAVLIEEFARQPIEIRKRLSVIVIDTVGIFWSLKLPTKQGIKELEKWDLKPDKTDVRVLVPKGKLEFYKKKEMPIDGAFTLRVSELEAIEWMSLFKLTWKDPEAILLSRIVENVKEKLGTLYGLDELITAAKNDEESEKNTRYGVAGRLSAAKTWGLFEKEGTKIREIAKPAAITIIDVSAYRQAVGMEGTRDVIVGLLGKRLFEERMLYRKEEEIRLTKGLTRESDLPIIWMMIDEAHMFMPKDETSFALSVLLEWVRVGRQPGLSLVLATQRPNKLHPDAISQCDLFISHRMTAQPDIDAVAQLRPSYLHQNFDKYFQQMPRSRGYALILDDQSEKLWLIKVRPRFSWDAGETASAFKN